MKSYVSTSARIAALMPVALMLGLFPISQTKADLAIQFSIDEGASFDTEIRLLEDDTATIGVYLTDSEINGPVTANGLQSFEFLLEADTMFSSITDAALEFPFENDPNGSSSFTSDSIDWDAEAFSFTPTGSQILLGNFEIVANAEGPTVFTASDTDTENNNWFLGSGGNSAPIDDALFGTDGTNTFSLTVVAVPEPSSMLVGFGLVALAASRRRRR